MSHFTYKAKRPDGEIYDDEKDAADRFELYRMIRDSGGEIVEFTEKKKRKGMKREIDLGFLGHVSASEKVTFARNLGLMISSGLSLSRALSVLDRQSKNKELKRIIADLSQEVARGSTFSDGLAKHPKTFPPIFIAMVHAGEQSGTLADSLKSVAAQMESSYNLERRVRGALLYPAVILGVMIAIGVLMFVFVVPTLTKVFRELGVELPLTTRIIVGISEAIQAHGLIALGAIVLVAAALWSWFKKPQGRRVWHALVLKIPGIGLMVQEVNSARTASTLSSLITSGVEVVEAVDITRMVVQNVYFKEVLTKAGSAIKRGELMSQVFEKNARYYPVFFAEMLSVGEETGKIGDMLNNVSAYYESDIEQKTKNLSAIIEPVLMVVIGAAVGVFAVSMISPIYSLVNAVH
jgi:type IV pilus assembly protein PilC